MDDVVGTLSGQWQAFLDFAPRLAVAAIILVLSYLLGRGLATSVSSIMRRMSGQRSHQTFFHTVIVLIFVYFGVVLALSTLGLEQLALSILAGGGVTAIILGFAFREIGENLIAGVFLAFSRPFNVGDLINTEGIEGKVRAIELRYTHLRAEDGRDIFIPSTQLFSKPVINYTRDGLRRFSFRVGIDYANDARAACALLQESVSNVKDVLADPAPKVTINSLEPQYVELIVHFWRNTFDTAIDGSQLRIDVIDACRKALLDNGYTVSADTTSNIRLSGKVQHGGNVTS